jgi:putative ABC transport system permease protein
MLQDLKNACRALLKTPWFMCVTLLTLALGIGANTAIFGVVNKLLLNPLPYPDADRLVYLRLGTSRAAFAMPTPTFVAGAWREQARTLEGVEGFSLRDVLGYDENGARVLRGMRITPGFPAFLGVAPLLGRGFTAADAEAGAPAVVMLSYAAWQRDYGGAPDVLDRAITLDEVSHTVVGVMPPGWDAFSSLLGVRPEVWFPLSLGPPPASRSDMQPIEVFTRLRPDVPVDVVTDELDALLADVPGPFFGNQEVNVNLERPGERAATSARDALLVLSGAVGLVLLVACSNVANLLLARGAARARELSVRSALGASTWRLVRALFAECLVLALAAGFVGIAFGWATLRVLVRLRPNSMVSLGDVQLDPAVLAFTFGVSVLTALLFGIAPALQLASRRVGAALRGGASGVVRGGGGPRVRKLLVGAQMAMSVVLLVSAGLLVRSVINMQNVDLGFEAENLLSAQLSMPRSKYETPVSRDAMAEQLLERIRSAPGVAAATQAFVPPPQVVTMIGNPFEIRGVTLSEPDARAARAFNFVRPDYFSTLGVRLLEGRNFTADELHSGAAIIVNRAAAQRYWPDGGALGAEVQWNGDWSTVVGIVDNVLVSTQTRSRDTPQFYFPWEADDVPSFIGAPPTAMIMVRAAGDPAVAIASLRGAMQALDPEIAIQNVLLTETALAATIDVPRFNMALLTAFAVTALALAAVGLAAVIRYEVTERTHEIGIRMALGAQTANVRRLAMRHGLTPALVGVTVGVVGALVATKLAASMLYGVQPRDPLTFVAVVVLLALVALGASWLPARRATRVDPIVALRAD